jgi:hypothetical protein
MFFYVAENKMKRNVTDVEVKKATQARYKQNFDLKTGEQNGNKEEGDVSMEELKQITNERSGVTTLQCEVKGTSTAMRFCYSLSLLQRAVA